MVQEIEELSAEIQLHALAYWEMLDGREICIYETRPIHRCAVGVTKLSVSRGRECTGIEERSGNAGLGRGIADLVWALGVPFGAAVGVREVSVAVRDREPIAGRNRDHAGELPPADQVVQSVANVARQALAAAEGQFVDVAEYGPVAHAER